jgi:hypothetical protein
LKSRPSSGNVGPLEGRRPSARRRDTGRGERPGPETATRVEARPR